MWSTLRKLLLTVMLLRLKSRWSLTVRSLFQSARGKKRCGAWDKRILDKCYRNIKTNAFALSYLKLLLRGCDGTDLPQDELSYRQEAEDLVDRCRANSLCIHVRKTVVVTQIGTMCVLIAWKQFTNACMWWFVMLYKLTYCKISIPHLFWLTSIPHQLSQSDSVFLPLLKMSSPCSALSFLYIHTFQYGGGNTNNKQQKRTSCRFCLHLVYSAVCNLCCSPSEAGLF